MDHQDKSFPDLLGSLKSLISWRSEQANVSRDFWMPDQSCRVCYECDSQFTLFNRRHHCRHCGKVFCAKCTSNWVPLLSDKQRTTTQEEWERIRVCNFCFEEWKLGLATFANGTQVANLDLSTSPSENSIISNKSSGTVDSSCTTFVSLSSSIGSFQQNNASVVSPSQLAAMGINAELEDVVTTESGNDHVLEMGNKSSDQFEFRMNRSDDDNDELGVYGVDTKSEYYPQVSDYYGHVEFDEVDNELNSCLVHANGEINDARSDRISSLHNNSFHSGDSEVHQPLVKKEDEHYIADECEAPSSLFATDVAEPVDFENNGLLWLPPEPEDEEDEKEAFPFDDDDEGDVSGEWGYLHSSSSFGGGEQRNRDRSNEEHRKAMKNVVDGHFRALVAQLLQVENISLDEEDDQESWLEIITWLSWEAATLLKPDTSKGGGMDPGGYVKVKCIASGRRSDSVVVKGVVCKKNVAHRRMTSRIEKPRVLILGGALEYQRVSNLLSSFDTLLQQEMDHLRMAVAKIDRHQPDVLLVEKSVSRFAQEYLLEKDISLVLNIKRPLLERIARCTGAQIVPSIDHLSSQKLGYCDMFHVERFLEEHGSAGQAGKKLVKTLMYFEGCPKPLGCTILLRGSCGDELKKVKHVIQYAVFAAYHLALETSFLADEGASLLDLPLDSPLSVTLPDKPSSIDRSIATIPGLTVPANDKTRVPQFPSEPLRSYSVPTSDLVSSILSASSQQINAPISPNLPDPFNFQNIESPSGFVKSIPSFSLVAPSRSLVADSCPGEPPSCRSFPDKTYVKNKGQHANGGQLIANELVNSKAMGDDVVDNAQTGNSPPGLSQVGNPDATVMQQDANRQEDLGSSRKEFPPSPSDHQSILVSLSSRCVWKGTVCERSHLFRIKYYGNFDKPLGRFLRDHLFDQGYPCRSCNMPSEAHVQCYTHRQGTLTISVKRLLEVPLPGEKEGKIWMWHRCLKCPRNNGFPPATRRIVMSDAAWGLSFGKFLELSFSNHAAASRVASCGHSLHRDCLRFYGFGKMVACFRYASIDVHSVYLPPPQLDFNYKNQDWIKKEMNEVVDKAELLFAEVLNALSQMVEKRSGAGPLNDSMKVPKARRRIAELEVMLQKEKAEFEGSLHKILSEEVKGQPVDIFEINRLRRQSVIQAYVWDQLLIFASNSDSIKVQDDQSSSSQEPEEKSSCANGHPTDGSVPSKPGRGLNSSDSLLVDFKLTEGNEHGAGSNLGIADSSNGIEENHLNSFVSMHPGVESEHLEATISVPRTLSDGQRSNVMNLSATLDAAWTGENHPGIGVSRADSCAPNSLSLLDPSVDGAENKKFEMEHPGDNQSRQCSTNSSSGDMDESSGWLGMPSVKFYMSLNNKFLASIERLDMLGEYTPVYVSSFRDLELQGGARLLPHAGVSNTVIPVYDDEPTSIIAYALVSPDYLDQLSNEFEKFKDNGESSVLQSIDSGNFQSFHSSDEMTLDSYRSFGSTDDSSLSMSGSRSSFALDPLSYTKALHVKVSFTDDGPLGKVKYSVTCYYAQRFEALRRICCPSETDFVRSLSRCKKWGAQGGKSNVFFAKTLDDRFIIKQVTKTELESFIKFAPGYFKYLSEAVSMGSPTCLAKILGIYQVSAKHLKGGKESKMDVLVMENLLFGRNVTRLYDLKGSSRSRYNPDASGTNKVLLDQNLIEAMPTSPIFVSNKAKRLLERAVWNDTAFLATVDVMDYSLLVGVDEEKHELVLGIIDFMRQYTWDKHLETWVKTSGILGGPKNASPTVISPKQYKKRFRKAMTTYFLMVPDQWSPPTIIPSKSQTELCEENSQVGASAAE